MPAANAITTGFEVDDARHTLRFVRNLDAAPAQAFAAWTEPAEVAEWWDATGDRLASCDIDLQPGGAFRFVTSHHPDKPFAGRYVEIAPPSLLVFEGNGATGRVTFDQQDAGTRMTVEIVCSSAEHLAQFVAMGVASGTSQTLNNLVEHVRRS